MIKTLLLKCEKDERENIKGAHIKDNEFPNSNY